MEQEHTSLVPPYKCVCSSFGRRDGNAETKDAAFVPICTQQAATTGESHLVRVLQAEYSLAAPFIKNSLVELQKAFRASQPYEPRPLCLLPLEAPILQTVTIGVQSIRQSLTEKTIFAHLLISVESFLASLTLLESSWDFAENCPSIPALFCDTILRRDPYRDSHEVNIARVILEHIDTHHASISREVNIELGSTYIVDPLPQVSENQCRCPLQRLDMFTIAKNGSQILVEEAYTRLTEVEEFIASHGLIDSLTAAKYFHSFEHRIVQLVRYSKSWNENVFPTQHGRSYFIPPRVRRMQPSPTNATWSKL
jgi:hypothetical protein